MDDAVLKLILDRLDGLQEILESRDCQGHSEALKKHTHTLYGNGRPGITERLGDVEKAMKANLDDSARIKLALFGDGTEVNPGVVNEIHDLKRSDNRRDSIERRVLNIAISVLGFCLTGAIAIIWALLTHKVSLS